MFGVYAMIGITLRVMCLMLLIAPSLGLFSLLRHLQAEQIPYDPEQYSHINFTEDILHFGNADPIPWSQINNYDYTSRKPPPYTTYSGLTLKAVFYLFVALLFIQTGLMWVAKIYLSQNFKQWNIFDQIIHSMINTNIPMPVTDWSDETGNCQEHYIRMKKVEKEIFWCMFINFVFNLINLLPMLHLGNFKEHFIIMNYICN